MTGANLKAVDRVVRIVRELDRYHGFCAAGSRRPEPSRLEAPAEVTMTFGAAFVCRPEFAPQNYVAILFGRNPSSPSPRFSRKRVGPWT